MLVHKAFYRGDPTPLQLKLYESFPTLRGVSSGTLDDEVLRSIWILSLFQTFPKGQQKGPFRAHLFLSAHLQNEAFKSIGEYTKNAFQAWKTKGKIEAIREFKILIPNVFVGSRVLSLPHPPERWSCFGFERGEVIPDWMNASLL